jgi:hypothetical protein
VSSQELSSADTYLLLVSSRGAADDCRWGSALMIKPCVSLRTCLFAKTRMALFFMSGSLMMLRNSCPARPSLSLSWESTTKMSPSVLLK